MGKKVEIYQLIVRSVYPVMLLVLAVASDFPGQYVM